MKNLIPYNNYKSISESESAPKQVTEKELLEWAKSIDDKNLLSWCGFSSIKDFEDSTDEKYSKKDLISFNFEDLEHVYLNQKDYGIN